MSNDKVIAEISMRQLPDRWFAWRLFAPGLACDKFGAHQRTASDALRAAVAFIEETGSSGRVGVLSLDGNQVAYVHTGPVLDYESLTWVPTVVGQVDMTALASGQP